MDRRVALLALAVLAVSALYLGWGLGPKWAFVLKLRAGKLAGLLIVGAAVGLATVLFQTVSRNRILTPQIMGFDALYILMQTLLVATLGVAGFAGLPAPAKFGLEVAIMVAAALALFGTLLGRAAQDIPRLILTGVILGVLFRSAAGFLARVMDPNDYAIVQAASFASFSRIDTALLPLAGALCAAAAAAALWLAPRLDVLALGRPIAVSLGLAHDRLVLGVLALVTVLVAISTALVGPVAFFGLIVAGLAWELSGTARHARVLPLAMLIGALVLVAGQTVFERFMGQQSVLAVVIEFAGGLMFLWLLLKGRAR
ncbi:iron chelate uptake ABC transporter family permease subunit [Gemmobacter sp.]|uniref:iron chelate uptake ABC transporter family permease subunit n=1 Tax=Gemmobacter sp. TaxID=1898957 RepID=UPI002AFE29BA|nr:iron chelate uptake ABC transporter family permease subunit [Gemmobacter sp.]